MKWIETQINGASVRIAFDADSIHIFDAYPIKEDLKRQGFRWNSVEKSWFLHDRDPQAVITRLSGGDARPVQISSPSESSLPSESEPVEDCDSGMSITQLRDRIEQILNRNLPETVWVRGVIVSEVKSYRWASYFDLGDAESDTPFFFRVEVPTDRLERIESALVQLGVAEKLEKDLPVLLKVSPSLAQRYAVDVRLTVRDIVADYTRSKLRNQREVTVEQLKREGIFDRQKKLTMPALIRRIGLISSSQGTSIEDIRSAMAPHFNRYQILFSDARMEGAQAVTSILASIRRFAVMKDQPDLIVLARGGGSEQSLAVFNDYRLCREICLSPIPVLAAIGHEKDVSAAELCAHLVPIPSTPSGVGRYLAQRYQQLVDALHGLVGMLLVFGQRIADGEFRTMQARLRHLPQLISKRLDREGELLVRQIGRCDTRRMLGRLSEKEKELKKDVSGLFQMGWRLLQLSEERMKNSRQMIAAHSPDRVLKRGFTLLFDEEGKVIGGIRAFAQKKQGVLHFHDGKVHVIRGDSGDQSEETV